MNEKLNELAELFRQRLDIDKRILELMGESFEADSEQEQEETPARRTFKRRPGKYGKANPMPEEIKEEMRAKSAAGVKNAALAKDFEVSASIVSKILNTTPERLTTKHSEVNNYVCENGHEFKSKMQPGFVKCPTCHSPECHLGTLNGPVNEEDN